MPAVWRQGRVATRHAHDHKAECVKGRGLGTGGRPGAPGLRRNCEGRSRSAAAVRQARARVAPDQHSRRTGVNARGCMGPQDLGRAIGAGDCPKLPQAARGKTAGYRSAAPGAALRLNVARRQGAGTTPIVSRMGSLSKLIWPPLPTTPFAPTCSRMPARCGAAIEVPEIAL